MKKIFTLLALFATCVTGAMAETWTVAGTVPGLGTEWDPTNTNNDMTEIDGVWTLVQENVTINGGNYAFKVCKDHNWTTAYPSNDWALNINEAGKYTITYTYEPSNNNNVNCVATKTADVDATITTVNLAGSFNGWSTSANALESNGENTWTTTLDLTSSFADPTFKLVINGAWIAYGNLSITAPAGWVSEAASDNNCELSNTTTGYQTYTITASWTPSSVASAGWTLTVEGATKRTFYLIYTDNEASWTVGDALTGDATLSISKAFAANELFAIASNAAIADNAVSDWTAVVRPTAGGNRFNLFTSHYSSSTQTGTSDADAPIWQTNDAGTYTIAFTPASATYTVDAVANVTISDAGWATYSTGYADSGFGYTITGADKVYYVSATDNGSATLSEIASGTVIPDGTGVIVKGTGSFTVTSTSATPVAIEGNKLTGTTVNKYGFNSDYKGYVLAKQGDNVGFYLTEEGTLAKHKAFIPAGSVSAAGFLGFTFDDESTGISSVSASSKGTEIYNLAGQRQSQLQKGLNIVGGKKVLVK